MDIFKLPYINMEDLSRDKPILCLLNTRARNTPERFIDHDLDACELGAYTGTLVEVKLHGYGMQLEGITIDTYGRLISVHDKILRGRFAPGAGLWILQVQQKLMDFLIKFCEAILDKDTNTLITQFPTVTQLSSLQIWSP